MDRAERVVVLRQRPALEHGLAVAGGKQVKARVSAIGGRGSSPASMAAKTSSPVLPATCSGRATPTVVMRASTAASSASQVSRRDGSSAGVAGESVATMAFMAETGLQIQELYLQ